MDGLSVGYGMEELSLLPHTRVRLQGVENKNVKKQNPECAKYRKVKMSEMKV
jgi:hypothetical protein